jgi:hypothetical protein
VKKKLEVELREILHPHLVDLYEELSRIPEEAQLEWLISKEKEIKQKIIQAGYEVPGCREYIPMYFHDTSEMIQDLEKGVNIDPEASPRKNKIRLNSLKRYLIQLDILGDIYLKKELRQKEVIQDEVIKDEKVKISFLPDGTVSGVPSAIQNTKANVVHRTKVGRPATNPANPFEWKGTEEMRSRLLQLLQKEGFIPIAPKAQIRRVFLSIFPIITIQNNGRTNDFLTTMLWRGTTPELGELLRQLRDIGLLGQSNGFYKKAAARFILSDGTTPSVRYLQSSSATIKEMNRKRIVAVIKKLS